jgi:Domain of unknown function (DU1801)
MLSRLRVLIKQADPQVVEEWKWMGTPVWSHNGLIGSGQTYKSVVKMTFAKGASLDVGGGSSCGAVGSRGSLGCIVLSSGAACRHVGGTMLSSSFVLTSDKCLLSEDL